MSYFPLFLDLSDRTVFVAGGGTIAERRIRAILPFVREIVVAAEKPSESLLRFAEEQAGRLRILEKKYETDDADGAYLVLACTDDKFLNRRITEESRKKGIPANNASDKTDCDFYFPGLVVKEPFVVGFTAGGAAHSLVKEARIRTESILEDILTEWKEDSRN